MKTRAKTEEKKGKTGGRHISGMGAALMKLVENQALMEQNHNVQMSKFFEVQGETNRKFADDITKLKKDVSEITKLKNNMTEIKAQVAVALRKGGTLSNAKVTKVATNPTLTSSDQRPGTVEIHRNKGVEEIEFYVREDSDGTMQCPMCQKRLSVNYLRHHIRLVCFKGKVTINKVDSVLPDTGMRSE